MSSEKLVTGKCGLMELIIDHGLQIIDHGS